MFLIRKVAIASTDLQVFIPGGMSLHMDLAISAIAARIRRLVSDAVLVADIARHFRADLIHFLQVFGEESHATSLIRKGLQSSLGPLGARLIAQNADGVNGGTAITLHRSNSAFQ